MSSPQLSAPQRKPGAKSSSRVLLGLMVLALAAIGGFTIAYYRLVHYDRQAVLHIPPGTAMAARLDVEQVVLYEPLRKHLFPVLNDARGQDKPPALERFERLTSVNLGMDLRELVFCAAPGGDWALLVGGLFPTSGVIEGLAQLLEQDQVRSCQLSGTTLSCTSPRLLMRQADDGVIVLASSEAQLHKAATPSTTFEELGMPREGAGAFVITDQALRPLLDNPLLRLAPGGTTLSRIQRANAELSLGQNADVKLTLIPGEGLSVEQLQAHAEQLLSVLKVLSSLNPSGGLASERQLLARASIQAAPGGLVVRSHYTQQELDLAAREIAGAMRAWLDAPD